MQITVKYYAGTYSGTMTVEAEGNYEAVEKVKRKVRKLMTVPMYSDGYKVVNCNCEHKED